MNSIKALATFFGWCTVINLGFVILIVVAWMLFQQGLAETLASNFGITQDEARATFFRVLQQHRLSVIVLNLVPYIALKIMSRAPQ